MKKLMALLVGGLMITLFAPMASASFALCSVSISGGQGIANSSGTATGCPAFTVPPADTLTEIDFLVRMDVQGTNTPGATETAVWSNYVVNGTPTANVGVTQTATADPNTLQFGGCVPQGCPFELSFTGLNVAQNITLGAESAFVTLSGSAALASTGSASGTLLIQYVYSSGVPEPATLGLTGIGLLAFGFFARKRRNRTS